MTATTVQSYILPTPTGWAVVTYGDSLVPDDEIIPLPYGPAMNYDAVIANFATTPVGRVSVIDGWDTVECFRSLEPSLAERVWGLD